MLATSGSSALSAWLFLIASAATIYRSAGQPLQLIACSQPDSFTVQITENENVVVYGTELLIKYNPRAGVYPLAGLDAVNVVYNESTVEFTGYMSQEDPATLEMRSVERLSWTSSGIILGTGTLQKLSNEDYAVQECRLFLPKNIKSSDNLPSAVKEEIANQARSCMEQHLCKGLEKAQRPIEREKRLNIFKFPRFGSSHRAPNAAYVSPQELQPQNCTPADSVVHLNINEAVDLAIRAAVSYVRYNNKSIITIPNVDESHELGPFGMNVYFKAINGSFEDLSTLKRTEDAFLSGIARTHSIKLGFGLGAAKFHYNYYKIKYGVMQLSGKITGIIDGLALSTKLVVDYDKECPVSLEYMKVTEFGDIKIKMTGLGPINSATSRILSWLTNMWQINIVSLIEVNVKSILEKLLSENACTSYITEMIKRNAAIDISSEIAS